MDKGFFKMIFIVGLVMLGLILLTKPHAGDSQPTQAPIADTETVHSTYTADTITAAELRDIVDNIYLAGTPEGESISYVCDNVVLNLKDGEIDGEIILQNPDTTLQYKDVVSPDIAKIIPDKNLRTTALSSLRRALETAAKYQRFARHLNPQESTESFVWQPAGKSLVSLEFSPRGGYISKAVLNDYYTYFPAKGNENKVDTAKVVMFDATDTPEKAAYYDFTIRTVGAQTVNTKDLYFSPKQVNDSTVEMLVDLGDGAEWGYRYTMSPDSYIVKMDIIQRNMNAIVPEGASDIAFHWYMKMPREERGRTFEERNSGIYYQYVGEKPDNIDGMKSTDKREEMKHRVRWVAFKNQFFSTVFIPRNTQFEGGWVDQWIPKGTPEYEDFVKVMATSMTMPYNSNNEIAASFDIFIGPNLYPLLKDVDKQIGTDDDLNLTRLLPLGWSWLRWINTLIIIPVFTFLGGFISNYGIIILLLTIFIKIIIFPFTYKSYISQAKMRLLAPEIKEINDKYPGKENAMVRQQKTMALYSKAGASPFSGCLPMLLQMPILIAMFWFFPSCIELRGESFLWAQNLAAPDVIFTLPFSIPFYGSHVSLFCLLMTATNIIYTRINMKNQPGTASQPAMKWMMYLMPVMFLFFFNDYASALSYYYFLSLLITIVQTWAFRKCINEKKMRQRMEENAKKPKKKSGLMARLEEAQRKQQAALREQQKKRR